MKLSALAALFLTLLLLEGCSTVSYLWQAGIGEWAIYNRERPLDEVLADPLTPTKVKERLGWVRDAKTEVQKEMGFKPTASYSTYADLKRPYAVWVLTMAERYELKPKEWSFPIVGSVPYLGFFKEEAAEKRAIEAARDGYDTDVRGATAFSTLGYLRDPMLSTMLSRRRGDIVNLIFHESTHSNLYIKGQGAFNEQAATFIGDFGELLWIERTYGQTSTELKSWKDEHEDRVLLRKLLRGFADRLKAGYAALATEPEDTRAQAKAKLFESFRVEAAKAPWKSGMGAHVDRLLKNNASLVSVLVYEDDQDVYESLFTACSRNLRRSFLSLKKVAEEFSSQKNRGATPQQILRERLLQAGRSVCFDGN